MDEARAIDGADRFAADDFQRLFEQTDRDGAVHIDLPSGSPSHRRGLAMRRHYAESRFPTTDTIETHPDMNPRFAFLFLAGMAVLMTTGGCSKTPETTVMTPADTTAVANVSDTDVTEHVKTALRLNDSLKGFEIGVVTLKGDVRMTGTVDTQVQRADAIGIARASEGVHSIHDEITIKQ